MTTNEYLEKGLEIVEKLNHLTYEAYLVGGVVRDYFLGNPFIDIDIATSATPDELLELYPNIDMTYSQYGTTMLNDGRYRFEITTFRSEEYTESRMPSKVHFSKNLTVDLVRRDFTINALAMTEKLKVIDLVGGVKDIKTKKIRMVGSNKNKFREDPLRILRGFELMSRFNFKFEKKTLKLMINSAGELVKVSVHHLAYALNRIFDASHGEKAIKNLVMLGFDKYLIGYQTSLRIVAQHYKKITTFEKFALCYAISDDIPKDTHFEKKALQRFRQIKTLYQELLNNKITPLTLFNNDLETLLVVSKFKRLLNQKDCLHQEKIKQMYNNLPIKHIEQLAFKGEDIARILNGHSLHLIKEIMQELLQQVLNKELVNDYYTLKNYVEKKINKMEQQLIVKGVVETRDTYHENKNSDGNIEPHLIQYQQEFVEEPVVIDVAPKKEEVQIPPKVGSLLDNIKEKLNDIIETKE